MDIEMVIELHRHKTTGKYFIYIQDTGADEALFINPEGKILSLPLSFFEDDSKEGEADNLFSKYPITNEQIERFGEYTQNRANEMPQDWKSLEGRKELLAWLLESPPYLREMAIRYIKEGARKNKQHPDAIKDTEGKTA